MKLDLPSIEELTLTINKPDGSVHSIDPIDVLDMMREASKLADKAARPNDWKIDFVELYESKYGYAINKTQASLIMNACREMTDNLVKKYQPSQKLSDSTVETSQSTE